MGLRERQEDEEWQALSRHLVTRSRRHTPTREDAEDLAQETLLRLARYDAQDGVPSVRYANQALRLAVADRARDRARLKEVPADKQVSYDDPANSSAETQRATDPDECLRRLAFLEQVDDVRKIVGDEVTELALKRAAGWTETQFDAERKSTSFTADALRKRLSRAIPELTTRLLTQEEDSWL